jgi:glycosyltransferase involved in cell wall biosynthesis
VCVRPRVLMVTGAYYPELSGGGLQARAIARALRGDADFCVLTTSTDAALPSSASEDGVPIRRVLVDTESATSQAAAFARIASAFVKVASRVDIVNQHGFSRKAIMLRPLSRAFGKKFVLTLQTGGVDEPSGARALGPAAYRAFAGADMYLSVSPGLSRAYLEAGLPPEKLRQVCNAVDVDRFAPVSPEERASIRAQLQLPRNLPIVLFVGLFTGDKRPDGLYRAWSRVAAQHRSALVFIGLTQPITHRDVDPGLARTIRDRAQADFLSDRVFFVEPTTAIARYFSAADIFVLPSIREGLSIALLEAMSSGLPCIASRLPGSTDVLIEHGVNGLLVQPDDEEALVAALVSLLTNQAKASGLGAAARQTVIERYSIQRTASAWLEAYREVLQRP